ncbi:MAG TPA: heavy metal-binding domain-containing protein [Gemmatimonadaceae bacterium]|nr:heavy metal-binding domain-containing protein [Gemmatimonadaceae bacterium]
MDSIIHSQAADIPYNMTTTGFDLPGYRIVSSLGVVRGVVVRSRSVFGTIGASVQTLFGGNISLFTELAERTRQQAFDTMLVHAYMAGADAVIGVRYDATELMQGTTEVLCYGTAVQVTPSGG